MFTNHEFALIKLALRRLQYDMIENNCTLPDSQAEPLQMCKIDALATIIKDLQDFIPRVYALQHTMGSDHELNLLGKSIVDLFKLKPKPENWTRYDLVGGDKTHIGVALTVARVFVDPNFQSYLRGE